jgi:hypothetical protein
MAEKKDVMADLQAEMEAGPPAAHVRNINLDTHVGNAPQRPYALLEDQMAQITSGYRDLGALQAALAGAPEPGGLPEGAPNPNDVVEDGGDLVRYVPSQDTREHFIVNGEVRERIRFEKRYVSLTMQGARAADSPDRPTDYWNGFTWLRGGFKPERDFAVMTQMATGENNQPLVFDMPASSTDVAVLHHEMRRADAARPSLPVETPKRSARKED